MKASRSQSSWTIRTPTTPFAMPSWRPGRWSRNASSPFSDAVVTEIAQTRPIMGQVASELSDMVIVTSDNPRSEDPLQIVNDIMVGVRRADARTVVEVDRAAAIHKGH